MTGERAGESSEHEREPRAGQGAARKKPGRGRLRGIARDIAIVIVVVLAVRAYQQHGLPSGPAPELSAVDLSGTPRSLESARGEPVLVHFWATWCGVCKAQRGTIDALARDHQVLSIATQSGSAKDIAAYVKANAISAPVVPDVSGDLARAYGVGAFPTSFVIDPDGKIRHVEVGYTTELGLRLRLWAAGAL